MVSVSKHMLRNKGVRTTYYDKNLVLDTNDIIHKNFILVIWKKVLFLKTSTEI